MAETNAEISCTKQGEANQKLISKLVKEYNGYKVSRLPNFRFNPDRIMFGKISPLALSEMLV